MLIYIIIEFPPLPHTDDSGNCWPRMNFVPIAARRASPRPRPGRKGYDRQITLVLAAASQLVGRPAAAAVVAWLTRLSVKQNNNSAREPCVLNVLKLTRAERNRDP